MTTELDSSSNPRDPTQPKPRDPQQRGSTNETRLRRVDQYESERLKDPDAFEACLGAIQADQIRIGLQLGAAVKRLLAGVNLKPENIREIEPSMSYYLRVTRQIERYRQLELRYSAQEASVRRRQTSAPQEEPSEMGLERKSTPK